MGGGAEMVVNLDMAVAGQSATLGFPEAKRGVTVGAGGVPRLVRLVGHTRGGRRSILILSCFLLNSSVLPAHQLPNFC